MMGTPGGQIRGNPLRARPFMMANVIKGLQSAMGLSPEMWRIKLETIGLTPEQLEDGEASIPLEQGFAAFQAAPSWAGDPAFFIDYAETFEVGGTGAPGFATVSARTVREALQTITRFMPRVSSMRQSRYEENDSAGSIVWQYPGEPRASRAQFAMWGVAVVMRRIRPALPADWKPHAVELEMAEPPEVAIYQEYFGPGLRFDRPINRFEVQKECLDRPPPEANERLFELMARLAEIEQQRRGVCGSEFEAEVRAAIKRLLLDGRASASGLAEVMGMSLPELRKEFKLHQLELRLLINDVRKEAARSYLLETDLPITEISFCLGYSGSSIFTRACHKWFGQPPRDVRARALPL